jgi:hypothetical protein
MRWLTSKNDRWTKVFSSISPGWADQPGSMEKTLLQPLDAEIVDQQGQWAHAVLAAYLGGNRWRGTLDDGREIVIDAAHVLSLALQHLA